VEKGANLTVDTQVSQDIDLHGLAVRIGQYVGPVSGGCGAGVEAQKLLTGQVRVKV
jgi:hypothetical protein